MSVRVEVRSEELVDVSLLKVNGQNHNRMTQEQRNALRDAIVRYGFISPIITNQELLISDRERRLEVARGRVRRIECEDVRTSNVESIQGGVPFSLDIIG